MARKTSMRNVVLITGCSSGIGRAAALYFHARGWKVIATMRSPHKEKVLTQLEQCICPRLDVTDTKTIRNAIAAGIQKFKKIDVVVNNAGYGTTGVFEHISKQKIQKQFDTNVFGLMEVIRQILPHFHKRKSGTIINITSIAGRMAFPIHSIYNASKWAVEGFSEALYHELRPFNIHVKLVEPGIIKTDFYSRSMDRGYNKNDKKYTSILDEYHHGQHKMMPHSAMPEAVAKVIFRAAVRRGRKFRYPAAGGARMLLLMRKLLPDVLIMKMIETSMMRRSAKH